MPDAQDEGLSFHGTKADLQPGDMLRAGFRSNHRPEVVMNHVSFTAIVDRAGLAAEVTVGDGEPRVYLAEPVGECEGDPEVTDETFPGNPTRSYRTADGLRVVGEVSEWTRFAPYALRTWCERIAALRDDRMKQIIAR